MKAILTGFFILGFLTLSTLASSQKLQLNDLGYFETRVVIISVYLDKPLPEKLEGKAGLNMAPEDPGSSVKIQSLSGDLCFSTDVTWLKTDG